MNDEDLNFDNAISNMFDNRKLDKNPERVIKFNNDVLSEITDDRYKRLMTEILIKVNEDKALVERMFVYVAAPTLNIILPPLVPENTLEIRAKGLAQDVVDDIMKIFAVSNIHLESI